MRKVRGKWPDCFKLTEGNSNSNKLLRRATLTTTRRFTLKTEGWKNVSGTDKSQSLLQHLDGWVTFWCEQHESSTDYLNSKTKILCFSMQRKKQFRYTKTNKSGRNGDLNVFECGMCLLRNRVWAVQAAAVWGGYSFGLLSTNFKHHSLPEYCYWPRASLNAHLLMATSSRKLQHVTLSKSSQLVSWTWQWVHCT